MTALILFSVYLGVLGIRPATVVMGGTISKKYHLKQRNRPSRTCQQLLHFDSIMTDGLLRICGSETAILFIKPDFDLLPSQHQQV
jgi:hypothetical protein